MTQDVSNQPTPPTVSHHFRVRYAETDAMGIAHHSSFLLWMEMGRTEFMRAFGFTYRELESLGVMLPVVELNVRYRRPTRYDDQLRIDTHVSEFTLVRIKMYYRIYREPDNELLAEGWTLHAIAGRDGRPIRLTDHPEALTRLRSMASHLLEE
jgi:acyl-CoA thioester hydrolase